MEQTTLSLGHGRCAPASPPQREEDASRALGGAVGDDWRRGSQSPGCGGGGPFLESWPGRWGCGLSPACCHLPFTIIFTVLTFS